METCSKPNVKALSNAQIMISAAFFLIGLVDGFYIKFIYVSLAFLPCWIAALVGNILKDIYIYIYIYIYVYPLNNSFNNSHKRLSTELSKHVWRLKEAGLPFKITWKFLKRTSPYNPVSGRCNLCLWEKYFIICNPELATLNKRNELATSCRHASKFLLKNFHPPIPAR